jgi:hypothetical protein
LSEDYLLCLRLCGLAEQAILIPEVVCFRRVHATQSDWSRSGEMRGEMFREVVTRLPPKVRRTWVRRQRALDLFTTALRHPLPSAPRRWWLATRALAADPTIFSTPMGRLKAFRWLGSALAFGPIRSLGRSSWWRMTGPPPAVRKTEISDATRERGEESG